MPVKLGSKLSSDHEARIEIIPLIDIMFFLLAAFMLVSLSLVNLQSVKVNLPTATTATSEMVRDLVNISVDKAGLIYLEKRAIGHAQLSAFLAAIRTTNETVRVFISGDADARHGDIVGVLDVVRAAGIQNVGLEIRAAGKAATRQASSAP